ncbi:MAG: hypothetical protein Q7R96_06545 [Nanoarchaeota archaeon]|nr:hypothetical protein [Nanoarchaeota archaeon]
MIRHVLTSESDGITYLLDEMAKQKGGSREPRSVRLHVGRSRDIDPEGAIGNFERATCTLHWDRNMAERPDLYTGKAVHLTRAMGQSTMRRARINGRPLENDQSNYVLFTITLPGFNFPKGQDIEIPVVGGKYTTLNYRTIDTEKKEGATQ